MLIGRVRLLRPLPVGEKPTPRRRGGKTDQPTPRSALCDLLPPTWTPYEPKLHLKPLNTKARIYFGLFLAPPTFQHILVYFSGHVLCRALRCDQCTF